MPSPHKYFDCPHCESPVPALLTELEAATAVVPCLACGADVYLAMGKLAQFQTGDDPATQATYDSGA